MPRKSKDDRPVTPPVRVDEINKQVDFDAEESTAAAENVTQAGAISAESIAFNEHAAAVSDAKRNGDRVAFNDPSAMVQYDLLRQMGWNSASLRIDVSREAGTGISRPAAEWSSPANAIPDGGALYAWVLHECHKQAPERTYFVRFMDGGKERGRGRISMPDTTVPAASPAPPQPNPYAAPPPGWPYGVAGFPPPGFQGYPQGYPPPQQPAPQAAPSAPPAPAAPPTPQQMSPEVSDLRAQVGYLSGQLAQLLSKAGMPPPAPPPPVAQPPIVVTAPAAPAPPPPAPKPETPGPPAGFTYVEGLGYISSQILSAMLMSQLRQTIAPPQPPPPPPVRHDPPPPPPLTGIGLTPPQPTLTSTIAKVTRDMEEATGGLLSMWQAAEKIRDALPGRVRDRQEPEEKPATTDDPVEKPFEVMDVGPVRVPFDPKTGEMKGILPIGLANADKIMDWGARLYERMATAAAAQNGGRQHTPSPTLPAAQPNWPPPPPMPNR
jgi:hypothetical protein